MIMAAGALAFGCSRAEEPSRAPSSGGEQESAGEQATVTFNVEHASLASVGHLVGSMTGLALVIDASVDPVAECLTISVLNPNRVTVEEVVDTVARAYAPVGVELRRTDTELVFTRAPGAMLADCGVAAVSSSQTPESRRAARERRRVSAQRRATFAERIREGMHEGPDERLLTRAAYDLLLGESLQVWERVRMIPHESNGRVVSIKLYGIRRRDTLSLLGFENGDGVRRVNGLDVTSPDASLEAYAQLRNSTEFHVELDRRGAPLTLHYRIVESLPTP